MRILKYITLYALMIIVYLILVLQFNELHPKDPITPWFQRIMGFLIAGYCMLSYHLSKKDNEIR